jgi:hypothetical protein
MQISDEYHQICVDAFQIVALQELYNSVHYTEFPQKSRQSVKAGASCKHHSSESLKYLQCIY